jgi:diacylglycerol kinase family enzyme
LIEQRLKQAGIEFEFLESKKYFQTFEIANTFDIDQYSALAVSGGDGSIHEVLNGMFYRQDKKRIPVAFIPNGSGNDMCAGLMLRDVNRALDYLVKGDMIKIDCMKINLDYERYEDIP